MIIPEKNRVKISDRISRARQAAFLKDGIPNETQKVIKKIHGENIPQIIGEYSGYIDYPAPPPPVKDIFL